MGKGCRQIKACHCFHRRIIPILPTSVIDDEVSFLSGFFHRRKTTTKLAAGFLTSTWKRHTDDEVVPQHNVRRKVNASGVTLEIWSYYRYVIIKFYPFLIPISCGFLVDHERRQAKGRPWWFNQSRSMEERAPINPMIKKTREYRRRR